MSAPLPVPNTPIQTASADITVERLFAELKGKASLLCICVTTACSLPAYKSQRNAGKNQVKAFGIDVAVKNTHENTLFLMN